MIDRGQRREEDVERKVVGDGRGIYAVQEEMECLDWRY